MKRIIAVLLLIVMTLPAFAACESKDGVYFADIDIKDYGVIKVQLDETQAPETVENFVKLAKKGYYDGLSFHRIIDGFMMQGGAGAETTNIVGEFSSNGYENNIKHNRGVISMARAQNNNSASSQFFIMHEDGNQLDGKYAGFGYVVDGIEIVDEICGNVIPSDGNGNVAQAKQPIINTITISRGAPIVTSSEEYNVDELCGDAEDKGDDDLEISEPDDGKAYFAEIVIEDYGTIKLQLNSKEAPITVYNFVKLADSKFYDGLTFHRIMDGFMMQGGDPEGDGTGGADNDIKGEFSQNGVKNTISHVRGVVSMARANDPDSASSQFFIVHEDSAFLDGQYAAFGYVVKGIEVVDSVCESARPTDNNGTIPKDAQPVIKSVTITREAPIVIDGKYDADDYADKE